MAIFLHCRPGFEREAANEVLSLLQAPEVETRSGSAYAFLPSLLYKSTRRNHPKKNGLSTPVKKTGEAREPRQPITHSQKQAVCAPNKIKLQNLVFTRQLLFCDKNIINFDGTTTDRVTPILEALERLQSSTSHTTNGTSLLPEKLYSKFVIEPTDSSSGEQLQRFCKKFGRPLENGLKRLGYKKVYSRKDLPCIHIVFPNYETAIVGVAVHQNSSPHYMGIPRLKFPPEAPSRSTLKLEEAFLTFLSIEEQKTLLQVGMTAVDLGASPGGWSYQFVKRKISVYAIDNGPMADSLMDSGLVEHARQDAFRYSPRSPVDWLVCDMIEKPSRVATLIGLWFKKAWCKNAIINLKLPMKKRREEVEACLAIISKQGQIPRANIACKQLYHDREEVTVMIRGQNI